MGTKVVPITSGTQQQTEKMVSQFLLQYIGEDAPTYPGQLIADFPQLFEDAFQDYASAFGGDLGELSQATIKNLISGKPAYTFDPTATAERWEETFASPVMAAWRDNVLPGVKEGFNLPGVLYSRGRGTGVAKEASRFYGQYVAPSLFTALQTGEQMEFQSGELAASRQSEALNLPFQQTSQALNLSAIMQQADQLSLTAEFQEYLRTIAEPGWAVQAALGYMTDPTMQVVSKGKKKSGLGALAGFGAGVGLDMLFPDLGSSLSLTGGQMGGLGAIFGGGL